MPKISDRLEERLRPRRGGRGWEVGRGRLRRPGWRRNACTGAGPGRLPRLSHTIPPPVKPPPPIQARLPFPSNNLPLRASSSLPHQWANIHDGVKAPAYLSHPRVSRVLPSFSPLHRKNDQKSYRGAKLTTEQTIASTSPVHVKRSSPIVKKNLSHFRTHFPTNPSHLDLNRPLPPAKRTHLLQVIQVIQVIQVRQVRQVRQTVVTM